jgi:hypothetical protein
MTDLKSAIRNVVVKGATARSENIAIDETAVGSVADIITTQVKPLIKHATNTEPWYCSRITVGAIVPWVQVCCRPWVSPRTGWTRIPRSSSSWLPARS